MNDLIISLNKNQLKLSTAGKNGFEVKMFEVSADLARDSRVVDLDGFSSFLNESISTLTTPNVKKKEVVFLVEPSEVFLRFIVLDKNTEDIEDKVISNAKEKLSGLGVEISDLYFSYQKIAPFVYQFIAIRQSDLDSYLQISNNLGMSLKAVIPWVLLLPKFLTTNDPCVFLIKNQIRNVIALAELNGIYYCEDLGAEKSLEEIQELVHQLSVYKRSDPINTVYTISENDVDLDPSFEVNPLTGLLGENVEAKGYETHLLTIYLLDMNPDYLSTQINLLNLLPLPVVQKKTNALVYVGSLVLLLLVGGSFLVYKNLSGNNTTPSGEVAPVVLSDSTPSEENQNPPAEEVEENQDEENVQEDLNKEELIIRVENGAGIQGIAGSTQTYLEERGYVVDSIGNSSVSDRTTTLLSFKPSAAKYESLLVEDMEAEYDLEVDQSLDEDLEYDLLITVGSN